MDDWYITCYNLVFTAFPLCVCALSDIDIKEEDSDECKNSMPLLYKESRDSKRYFTLNRFIFTVVKSIILSCIIFLLCSLSTISDNKGHYSNIWYMSLKNFTCILIVISINLFIEAKFIVYLLPIVVIVTTFIFYFVFLFLVHYGLVFNFNSKASIFPSLSVIKFYLILLVVSALIGVIDYSLKVYNIFFVKSLKGQLELKRAMLATEEIKINDISNSSLNRSEMRKEGMNNNRILSYQIDGDDKMNKNESVFESSNIRMKNNENNDDLYNLNCLNNKSRLNNDSNNYFSRIYQNSSSLSSCSQQNNSIQSNCYAIKKGIKNKNIYNESFMDIVNNKKSEKVNDNIIHIMSINNKKRNRISLLRKVDNNIMNNTTKNNTNTFVNNEKNDNNNNQNTKTTEIMITTELLQFNKK
jgi:hypothetical protein